jgi:8-oxo-dGTP diphosphatase
MIAATLGFVFSSNFEQVLLIHKNRPAWQAGRVNGLGGKVETGETPVECISREVQEETGLLIPVQEWHSVGEVFWTEWEVTVWAAQYVGSTSDNLVPTDEPLQWYPVAELPTTVMSNLRWLIPLAHDVLTNDSHLQVVARYEPKLTT